MSPEERAEKVYEIIKQLADPNALIGAASGIVGSGVNLVVDVAALPFYWKMWNDIRELYGHGAITKEAAFAYLRPNIPYLIQDIIFDKIVGSVPLVGIPFNYIYAKALTWRLGAWFGLLSAIATARGGDDIPNPTVTRYSLSLVQQFFPPEVFMALFSAEDPDNKGRYIKFIKALFSAKDPDKYSFIKFIGALEGLSDEEAQKRLKKAYDALQGE